MIAPNFKVSDHGSFPKDLLSFFREAKNEIGCKYVSHWGQTTKSGLFQATVATTYPAEWLHSYIRNGYSAHDPILLDGLRSVGNIAIDYSKPKNPEQERMFQEFRAAGLGNYSISVPVRKTRHEASVSTFTFESVPYRDREDEFRLNTCCRKWADLFSNHLARQEEQETVSAPVLTAREKEILLLLSRGYNYQQIAESINVSRWTVIAHASSLRSKLGAKTNVEALSIASTSGTL